ncbi:MAG: 4-alpha-glucanotransferase [Rhodospirillales bacterium]|nr:4-alpha-glucanotransferase [Rhodospirillales bacterium]
MTNEANLGRLVHLAGVETDYWDIWGNHHLVGEDAQRSILAALGFPAQTRQETAQSIQWLEEREWRRPLPPVLVARVGEAISIPLSLPAARAEWPVALEIIDESGAQYELIVRPGEQRAVDRRLIDGGEVLRYAVPLKQTLPLGYHTVRIAGQPTQQLRLIIAPNKCYLPEPIADGGVTWGISAQLYTLQRAENWGIGDFTDLYQLIDTAADLGAAVVGLNPLHILFLAHPEDASPYSPSSRLFLNPLYIDVEAVPGYASCAEAHAAVSAAAEELAALRERQDVAYRRIKALKIAVLEATYRHLRQADKATAAKLCVDEFEAFCAEQGRALRLYALFEALSEAFDGTPWHSWPKAYQSADTSEVAEFARTHEERIGFFEYLQWLADRQLEHASKRALTRGLTVGIYRDLAVGASRDGADAWSDQQVIVQGAKVGCPPDPFNMLGQDWGIPPLHPFAMRDAGYAPFIAMLRANMRHAGGLRIDHVMGLMHLFWIPADGTPAGGAYVKYFFEEMLAVLALESQRNRCLVVGEDLGTVPEGFRERMAEANVLSYRVLYFEKDGDRFKQPCEYPGLALACVSTHDLATITGFWAGADVELKARLSLYPSDDARRGDAGGRRWDKTLLLRALASQSLLPNGIDPENPDGSSMTPTLIAALHAYLARSPARILLVQIDDLMEEIEQVNLPGTVDERPNWRRRLSHPSNALATMPVVQALRPALAERTASA